MRPIITLLTDFGSSDSYVGQMKGVLLSHCPDCTLVDISHEIPAQDIRTASRVLAETVPRFPKGTVHTAVVDPGVGTKRFLLAVEIAQQKLVLPDNGMLTQLLRTFPMSRSHHITAKRFWSHEISPVFHGRDIIAPVAAFLALGGDISQVGPEANRIVRLTEQASAVELSKDKWLFEVIGQDRFGNLTLNSSQVITEKIQWWQPIQLWVDNRNVGTASRVKAYAQAAVGELVLLVNSQNNLELAKVNGSAAQALQLQPGAKIAISVGPIHSST